MGLHVSLREGWEGYIQGVYRVYGGFPKYLLRGSRNKGYSVLGSILGSPDFGKLPYTTL